MLICNAPVTVEDKKVALLFVMLLFYFTVKAQHADTLKEFSIKGERKHLSNDERINTFSPGQKIVTIDSQILQQYQFQSVASLLSQQVPVFVKSYGFNNLATLNFRGASAAQSQVYWNGVPLSNAAPGITDVSMLQTSLYNKVSIVYGGSTALWGSGNVGGALLLENERPHYTTTPAYRTAVSAMTGSFAQYQLAARSNISLRKWYVSASVAAQDAQNDFTYHDNGLLYRTANSKLQSASTQLHIGYKLNDKNNFNFIAWAQNYSREIPKALFEALSVKKQEDASTRFLADWLSRGKNIELLAKLSYLTDRMHYSDSVVAIDARYYTQQLYGEFGSRYKLGEHHRFLVFLPVHLVWMEREQQHDVVRQPRIGIAGAYNFTVYHNRLNIALQGRLRLNNDKSLPVSGLNISYKCTNWFSIRTNIQRSYRLPTLTELYYLPGGNPLLKPEQGWTEDIGYTVKTSPNKPLSISHDISLFNRRISDWIVWFGGAIWTPHNIAEVHSRGIETETSLRYNFAHLKLHIGANTSYVLATTVQSYIPGDGSIGRQIPYSPRYNGQANIGFSYKAFYFNYNHTYTGYRFITVDESSWLMPYNTGNVQMMYTRAFSKQSLQFSVQCHNIWNSDYSVVNGRPMPGVNWLASLTVFLQ